MTILKLSEAKAHLGKYARSAAKGHSYVIADHNVPLAVIAPYPGQAAGLKPKIGLMDGQATIPDDFDHALDAFEADVYGS